MHCGDDPANSDTLQPHCDISLPPVGKSCGGKKRRSDKSQATSTKMAIYDKIRRERRARFSEVLFNTNDYAKAGGADTGQIRWQACVAWGEEWERVSVPDGAATTP